MWGNGTFELLICVYIYIYISIFMYFFGPFNCEGIMIWHQDLWVKKSVVSIRKNNSIINGPFTYK